MHEKDITKAPLLKELLQRIDDLESSRDFLQTVIDGIGDPLIVIDPHNYSVVLANEIAKKSCHGQDLSARPLTCYQISHRRDAPCATPEEPCPIKEIIATKEPVRVKHIHYDADHNQIHVDIIATPIFSKSGEVVKIIEACRDITEIQKIEESLKQSEEKYRSLVESTSDSIYLVDKDYKYLFMNRNHIARMGFAGDEYQGRSYSEFHTPDETNWFVKNVDRVFSTGRSLRHEHKSLRDGRYFLQTLSPVLDPDGAIRAVTIVSKDISELKTMEEKLHTLSTTDELTGLFNRRGFFPLADQQLKLANRQKTGIFMLYADLNGLKMINDTYGHKEGDSALIEMANLLKKSYRDSDIIARIGGDEFVVIPVGTSGDNIDIITDRFQKALETHNEEINRDYRLSASVGISYYDPADPISLDELLMQADRVMYEQKKLNIKS